MVFDTVCLSTLRWLFGPGSLLEKQGKEFRGTRVFAWPLTRESPPQSIEVLQD